MKARWHDYRRTLRQRDQPHFDRLFEHADTHADAAGYLNPDDPMNPILVSMLLEHQKRITDLEEQLDTHDLDDSESGNENAGNEGTMDGEDGTHTTERKGGTESHDDRQDMAGVNYTEPRTDRRSWWRRQP